MKSKTLKINVALSGASGRMGGAVRELIRKKNSGFFLAAESPPLSAVKKWDEKKIKGVIDFSAPELFSRTLKWCVENKKPFVSGTTALSPSQKKFLKSASRKIPVVLRGKYELGDLADKEVDQQSVSPARPAFIGGHSS